MRLHERPKASRAVLEQETALTVYLDALLQCVPDYEPEVVSAEDRQAILPLAEPVMPDKNADGDAERLVVAGEPQSAEEQGARPAWAVCPFKTLLFRVNELTLAVPLSELNGIVAAPETITGFPGGEKWLLGLMPYRGSSVKIIDIAYFMATENRHLPRSSFSAGAPKNIVLAGGASWGFPCHDIVKIVTTEPHQVRWRSDRQRRSWLAGFMNDPMCALIDVQAFSPDSLV
ncbi:MAG: chemotaxis protein CheW [Gammaproteobacteria bacterium]|nr:chemotaxis protein CheW [Gammaproteobacteria bacterium]